MTIEQFSDTIAFMNKKYQNVHIFDSFVNHEIKSALASTKAYTELLKRSIQKENKEKTQDYTEKTAKQLEKVIVLFTTAMDAERVASQTITLHKELIKVSDFLDKIAEEHDVIINNSLNIDIHLDTLLITKALEYLIQNAKKYTRNDKKIIIQTEKKDTNNLCIYVEDFGEGITIENQQNLFHPFSKGEKSEGLGLGLFIAKTISQLHGGDLLLKSSNITGTTFSFILPIH